MNCSVDLGHPAERPLDGFWQVETHEIRRMVQVIFAGFVNHANQIMVRREGIGDDSVQFTDLERRGVVVVT